MTTENKAEMNHSPEPWAPTGEYAPAITAGIHGLKSRTVILLAQSEGELAKANVRRASACVNACQGIEDPETTIKELVFLIRDVIDMAEEGFRNCESDAGEGVEGAQDTLDGYQETLNRIEAVIEKLKGVK